jgi:hypothetical protein
MSKRKEIIKKDNFTHKESFPEQKQELIAVINKTAHALTDTSIPNHHRGHQYFTLLQEFLSSTKMKGRITPDLCKHLIRDIGAITKPKPIFNPDLDTYERVPQMDLYVNRPSIKAPRCPYVFITLKCRTPKSNNYTSITKEGTIKPKKLKTAISNYFNQHNLSFTGITEYSLERLKGSDGKKVWRSVLHYHYFVPLLSIKPSLTKKQIISYSKSMLQNITELNGSQGTSVKLEASRQLKHSIQQVFVLAQLPTRKAMNDKWATLCRSNDLLCEDVHFAYGKDNFVFDQSGLLECDVLQAPNDSPHTDRYLKKSAFLPWKDHRIHCKEGHKGKLWKLKKKYGTRWTTESIDITTLFNHYRNCRVGLPSRTRKGMCVKSHPLYAVVCELIDPTLLYDQYDEWHEQEMSKTAQDIKGQIKRK